MRALFLLPPAALNTRPLPVDRVYGCNWGFDYKPAIHFCAVATYAQQVLGWSVRLLDAPAEGLDWAAVSAEASRADVVLFWCTYLSAWGDLRAARLLQAENPHQRFVFMGSAATWRPEELALGPHSHCLLGEPEGALHDLAAAWAAGRPAHDLPGVAAFVDGSLRRGPPRPLLDVTTLPMPDRGLFRATYRANRFDHAAITTLAVSRGCGFRCTFCTTNAMDQCIDLEFKRGHAPSDRPPLRKRTPAQVIAEFEDIAARGIRGVEIADNIFTWGRSRTMEICAAIAPLKLEWICLARANMLHDQDLIAAMGAAGCKLIYMGSESFDDGLLTDMVKEIKVRDIERAVATCRAAGVEPEVSVLIGASPKETWGTLFRSWRMSRQLGTRFVHFSVALPAPSTQMYDDAIANGWFDEGDFRPADNQREVIVNLPHLSKTELRLALKLAYAAQYLAPKGVLAQARRVHTLGDLRHKARAASTLLRFLAEPSPPASTIPPGRVTPR